MHVQETAPGATGTFLDENGKPVPGMPTLGGGPTPAQQEPVNLFDAKNPNGAPIGMSKIDAENLMKAQPGRYSLAGAYDPAARVIWHSATPAENVANGLPPNAKGAQVSNTNEFKPAPSRLGQVGPLYDPYGKLIAPTADYSDPQVAAQLQSFQAYQAPPKALPPQNEDKLAKDGQILNNYADLMNTWKPQYAHTATSVTDIFGKSPANEWWYKFDNVMLPQLQALGGGRKQIADKIAEALPKRLDAGNVVPGKLQTIMDLLQGELNRKASSLATEGYNRGAIETAVGFKIDPMKAITDAESKTIPTSGGAQKPPAVGTVEDGHRFKGGDPADPKSWEAVR